MVKNKTIKIILLIIIFLFLLILPNYSNAAKVSVGKVKGVKLKSQTTTSIKISWNSVSKASGYRVYICDNSNNKYKYYGKTKSKSITIKKLKSSKDYKIKIRAYRTVKKKTYYGSYSSVLKVATKPTQVQNLKVKSQNDKAIKLSWDKVTRATAYRVYVYNEAKKAYEYYKYSKSNSVTIENLQSGKEHKIKVRAYKTYNNKKHYGAYSNILKAVTKPEQVNNLISETQSDNSITLSWNKVTGATAYRVYKYNETNKAYEYFKYSKGNSVTLENLESSKEYKFKIRAYKTYNSVKYFGTYSNELITSTIPSMVKELKVISQTESCINLEWKEVLRASGYDVYIYNNEKDSYDFYGSSLTTSITIKDLKPSTIYKIKVKAYNEIEEKKYLSEDSNEILETLTKPCKVLNFQIVASDSSSIKLSWDEISGVTGYKLYIYKSSTKNYEYYGKTNKNYIEIEDLDYTLEYKFKVRAYKTFNNVQHFGKYSDILDKKIRQGIDVSKWQAKIDWEDVKKSGVELAVIRIGYRGYSENGKLCEDPYFKNNIKEAIKNKIEVGVYFFSYAIDEEEAIEEAKWVVDTLKESEIDISKIKFIAHDFETYNQNRVEGVSKKQINKNTIAFLKYVKEQGYIPMLYASKYYLTSMFNMEDILSNVEGCKVWLAQYNSKATYDGIFHMWQYTSEGSIDGISGNVDLNKIYF